MCVYMLHTATTATVTTANKLLRRWIDIECVVGVCSENVVVGCWQNYMVFTIYISHIEHKLMHPARTLTHGDGTYTYSTHVCLYMACSVICFRCFMKLLKCIGNNIELVLCMHILCAHQHYTRSWSNFVCV